VQRIKKVRRAIFRDIARAQRMTLEAVAAWDYQTITTNAQFYDYQIDVGQIRALSASIAEILKSGAGIDAAQDAARAAYAEGVGKASANLAGLLADATRAETAQLSDAAAAFAAQSPGDAAAIRMSDAQVMRRTAIAGARVFELMEGFAGETAADLARVLFAAIEAGDNPRDVAGTIRDRFGVSRSRGERIARTEITGALRRGRVDEARDTGERLNMGVRMIHYSALIAGRTRRTHAARHGKTYTPDEVAQWYTRDANGINCLCSQSETFVDDQGKPIFGTKLLDRMGAQREKLIGDIEKGAP
jgi:SPP1 gp7 family putative phage head morphogenesis protein